MRNVLSVLNKHFITHVQYTYIRECREMTEETTNKTPTWVILSESKQISSCPEKSGVVRVNDYKQNLTIQHKDENTTKRWSFFSFRLVLLHTPLTR